LKAAFNEAGRAHKSVILGIEINSEDYDHLPEEILDRIIKFAKLHPKNLIAKKINSTALVCRGIQNMKEGSNEKALNFFEDALNVDNGLNKAREWAANLHFKEKNY
jgi:Tfp pilus assembly protein PilF